MNQLFRSGVAIDAILLFVAIEFAALGIWHRRTGRGPSALALAPNLAAGACLLLAVRAALVGSAWPWIAGPITLSLVAHLLDLRARRV